MKYDIAVTGGEQLGRANTALKPLEVQVRYESGDPVFQLPVKFRLISGDGRFEHRDALTDIMGCAVAEFIPGKPGPYRIDCLVGGKGGEAVHFTGTVDEAAEAASDKPDEVTTSEAADTATEDKVCSTEELMSRIDAVLDDLDADSGGQAAVNDTAASSETTVTATDQVTETEAATAAVIPTLMPMPEPTEPTAAVTQDDAPDLTELVDRDRQPAATGTLADETASGTEPEPEPLPIQPESTDVGIEPDDPGYKASNPGDLGTKSKIGIAVLALFLALLIAGLVSYAIKTAETPAPPATGSIRCSSSSVKQVGHTYVFENCTVKP